MKNLITYLKALWSWVADSQSKDISIDRWLTVGSPSFHRRSTMLKLVSVLVLLLTIGSGNAWGTTASLTNAEIKAATAGNSYASRSVTSSSGTWSGTMIINTSTGYVQINKNKNNYYLGSPTFAGGVTQVSIETNNSTASGRVFYIRSSTSTAQPTSGDLGQGSTPSSNGTATISITGSPTSFYIYSNGAAYIKAVTVTYTAACAGTQLETPEVTTTPSNQQIQLSWPAVDHATKYQVSWNGGAFADATSPYTKSSITNGTSYTWAIKAIGNGSTYCDSEVNEGTTKPGSTIRTVTWKVNGETYATTYVASGDHLMLPASPSPCAVGKVFAGWSETNIGSTPTDTKPTFISSQTTISANKTYHAVFATRTANSYTKGDINDLFPGQTVLIVNETGNVALSDEAVSGKEDQRLKPVSVTISSSKITSMSNSHLIWTVENRGLKYNFKTGTGYLRATTSGNDKLSCGSGADPWTLTANSGKYYMNSTNSGTSRIQYYSSGTCFQTYGSNATGNNYSMSFFVPTYTQYITQCCTQLGSINGSVNLTTDGCGAGELKATWKMLATTGIASQTLRVYDENLEEVTAKRITGITASTSNQTKTISGLNPCKEYYVTVENVSSGGEYCAPGAPWESDVVTTLGYTYTITKNNVSLKDGESEAARACEDFMAEYVADAGYDLPATISVTGASSYTWEDGVLMIDKADVTGNVTVTITGTAQSNFINGETVFIQADSKDYSAWKDDACVKAWFNNNWSGGSAETTYWLFDATDTDAGKKLFATVVPASGDLNIVQLQRFAGNCSDKWNDNGSVNKASSNGVNTFRSYGSADNNVAWNGSSTILYLYGSQNSWASSLATFADQGAGVWTASINNYTPDATSKDYKIKTSYNNGWIGNTGSNNNATLSGMIVGSTYNVTATLNVTDHSLVMSKTFVKGEVSFDLQGHGSAISKLTNVAAGSKISAPSPAPSATGWDFGGWFKEPACTNEWNFASDEVDETMTLYAKWTKHTYTITSTLTNCSASPSIPSSYEYTGTAVGLSYTITPSSGYRLPTEITVSGTTYTWNPATGALALTGTISSNVTITIVAVQTHTVDWYVGGSAPANKIGDDGQTTVVDHGGKISDFPATTPDGSPCDKTFVGWTNTTSYTHGTSLLFTDVAGSPTIEGNTSFYAVFAEGGEAYNLVESDLGETNWAGDYLIAYSSTVFADGRIGGTGSNSIGANGRSVDPDDNLSANGKVVDATWGDTYNVTLELVTNSTNTYVLKTKDGNYNYISSNTNGINTTQTKGTAESHPISITFTSSSDIALCSHSTKFHYNTSSSGYFRFYSNGSQSAVYFYKKSSNYTGHTINCADCGTSVTPTYTAAPTGGTVSVTKSATPVSSGSTVKTCTAVDLTVTITPATHYTLTGFTATGLTTGTATISPAVNTVVPTTSAQTFTVTVSAGATGTLNLTPTFTPETPLTITLDTHSKGTFTPIGTIYSGDSFTFPEVTPNDAECADFVGWVEGTSIAEEGTSTEPTTIAAGSSSGTLTTNKTYTAVYAEKDKTESDAYVKVTSSLSNWSGTYLIVHDGSSRALDGSLTTTLGSTGDYFSVSITDGAIAATSTLATKNWTIAKIGETSTYTIKSASGYYIGRATASNGLDYTTAAGDADANSITYSSGVSIAGSASTAKLQYWVSGANACFKYYTSSQNAVSLYKLGTAEIVTYTYTVNPACTAKYRVTVNSATGGSPTADPKYLPEGETATLTANPAAGYTFTSWTITKTTGGDNVTSTLLTGDKPTTANTSFAMPAYDVTVTAAYAKIYVTSVVAKDGETTLNTSDHKLNINTGANKTVTVVVTPADAFDHSWSAEVTSGGTYASISNVTSEGFRVNGLAEGDATIVVTAPNDDGADKTATFTVHVTDVLPEEIILKRDGSNTPIETLIMYYDETNSKGQYVKVNVGYSPANPTNKAFTFSSALTGKVGSHSHAPASGYEVLVANGVTASPVNCTFTSSADGSVTKVLAVTVLPILTDRFVDYVHGNATQTVSARLSDDRYSIIPDINTPSLSDASDANPTSEDCETSHYHLVGWLPQTTAEALWAAGTPITDATEGLVRAGESVEATGQTWCAIWAEEQ